MNPTELIALARALVNGVIAGGSAPVSQTELRRDLAIHILTTVRSD